MDCKSHDCALTSQKWQCAFRHTFVTAHKSNDPLLPQETNRYRIFKDNVIHIVLKLATCPLSVWPHLNNQFMDWSPTELKNAHQKRLWIPATKPGDTATPKNLPQQLSWDWRRSGKVTPAKDQGRCGSCYAFAAVAAIESKLLIQYSKTDSSYSVDLSEQHVIDCVNKDEGSFVSNGCDGGSLEDVLAYAARQAWREWCSLSINFVQESLNP